MRNLKKIVLLLLCLFANFSIVAEAADNLVIQQVTHPDLADKQIYAVCGKDGIRIWALRNAIFVENKTGSITSFNHENSTIRAEGNIADIGYSNGDIWVVQTAPSQGLGVFRHDGKTWEQLQFPDAPGLLNNYVIDIHVDRDDQTWFGHRFHGISRYVERVIPTFSNSKIMHLYDCNLLNIFMQETHLWIGTTNGIVRLRTELKSNYDLNVDKWVYPEFPAREAFSVCDYVDDMVIAGTSRGLALFNGKKWSLRGRAEGIKALPVNFLQRQGDKIWLGSPVGLQLWGIDEPGQLITEADGLPGSNITALALDENGNLLVGTEKGPAMIRKK